MAMTKREQAAYDAAIKAAETVAALRWTEPVEPDLAVPTKRGEHTQGWRCFSFHTITYGGRPDCVYEAWSESCSHGDGDYMSYPRRSGGRRLYSTKLRALLSARHEVEKFTIERLRHIDLLIQQAQQEQDAK